MPAARIAPLIAAAVLFTGCVHEASDRDPAAMYELSGSLTSDSGEPLVAANVVLEGTGYGAATGPDGRYVISAIPAGAYTVRVTRGSRLIRTDRIRVPGERTKQVRVRVIQEQERVEAVDKRQDARGHDEVFVVTEVMPKLIGGLESVHKNLQYTHIARKAGIEGRVIVQFVVDADGAPRDLQVVRGLGAGLDEAAMRAVSQARFQPGYQRGRAVAVRMSLPITFKLG